jgi:hypothetical protein
LPEARRHWLNVCNFTKRFNFRKQRFVNTSAKPTSLAKVMQLLVWVLGLLYVFSRLIPCHSVSEYALYVPVDDAWAQVMHVAYAQHMQFGRDIVFTYGPWGFLARGYYPPTYPVSVMAWLVLSLVFIWAGWRLARHFTNNQVLAWLWLIGFTAATGMPLGNDISNRLTAWGLLLLFLHFFVEEGAFSPLQAALVFTLGWLGLVKFTGLMEGGFLVVLVVADNIVRHRRFTWVIPVWLAGIVFFWLLAGQHLGWLWPFLKNSWEVANGYTDAMYLGRILVWDALIYVVLGLGFCVLGAMLARSAGRGILCALGIGGILFLSFKQGFVRGDSTHEITAVLALLLAGLAGVGVAVTQKNRTRFLAAILFGAAIIFVVSLSTQQKVAETFPRQLAGTFTPGNLFAPVIALGTDHLQVEYEKKVADLGGATSPPLQGGADLYSYCQEALFANGITYHPRPVIQSYSAYTPALAKMNADWLRTGQAAPNLFFAIQLIDDRFPSLDDGLSWPELLTLYDIKGVSDESGKYLFLSRSPTARKYHLWPLPEATVKLGQTFPLSPATNGLIWAEIEVKKTLVGSLLSFFYKPTELMVGVKLADQRKQFCRLIPGVASAGFLLSPYIADNRSFLALAQGNKTVLAPEAVVSMVIFDVAKPDASLCYQSPVKIRFYRLEFPAQDSNVQVP